MGRKTALSWSSGKDSAWALWQLQQDPSVELVELVTTVNQTHKRVAMHAVRQELLRRQAEATGLPLVELQIPHPCSNDEYEAIMRGYVEGAAARGIEAMAFGDLYLEDVRRYREHNLRDTGITPLFPLWQIPTRKLAEVMVDAGLRAVITCVDPRQLSAKFAGRTFDADFLTALPQDIDPCGENGEFHSFVTHCPAFSRSVEVRVGEIVEREGFTFADLLPDPS